MTKKNIMPVVVLTVICIVVAALLGGVNMLTKGKIAENNRLKEQASLIEVLPTELGFNTLYMKEGELPDAKYELPESIKSKLPESITSVYGEIEGKGYVFVLSGTTQYSSGDMTVSVGISGGKVVGVSLTGYYESKDFGKDTYPDTFVGLDSSTVAGAPLVSGVTYSSTAFKSMITDALTAEALVRVIEEDGRSASDITVSALSYQPEFEAAPEPSALPKTNSELLALAKELVPSAEKFDIVNIGGAPESLKRLYKAGDCGYVAYIVVPGAYVPVATEALVHIGNDGIIENVNLLSWIVGHDVGAGDFADRFADKHVWNYYEVELVSGATGTSSDFYVELNKTLELLTDKLGVRGATFLDWVDRIIPNSKEIVKLDLPKNAPATLKALYQETSGRGSVAYIVVPGAYVPVATEALVYFDEFGTIRDVDLRSWIVGHGVGAGDFADRFIGKNIDNISEVELVTAATGTSGDFRDALIAAYPHIPTSNYAYRYIAIAVLCAMVVSFTAVIIINRRRRAAK